MGESDRIGEEYWTNFNKKCFNRFGINRYSDVWKELVHESFVDAINEGIINLQARLFVGHILSENGDVLGLEQEMQIYTDCLKQANKIDPHFTFSIIVQGLRTWNSDMIKDCLAKAYDAKKKYPHLIIGFDLVDDETKVKACDYGEILFEHMKLQEHEEVKLPFLLHGGETLSESNDNLIDLLVLKCPRVGHGINLIKHSYLLEEFKKEKVCIEASPISNQVLNFVSDLRHHPLRTFLNYGVRVSISSDDDGVFDTGFLTWDFFACAVSMDFNLSDFKIVCNDSIEASCLGEDQKGNLMAEWEYRWTHFIEELLEQEII